MTRTCDRCGCLFLASDDEKSCAACLTSIWGGGRHQPASPAATSHQPVATPADATTPEADARADRPADADGGSPTPNRWVRFVRGEREAGPWWRAFWETARDGVQAPERFFDALRGAVHDGGHRYFLLGSVVPQALGMLLVLLLPVGLPDLMVHWARQGDGSGPLASLLPMMEEARSGPGSAIAGMLVLPLTGLISLYVGSLISHGVLLLLGRRGAAWEETRQLFLYAEGTTGALNIVPVFGGLLASAAAVWLETTGLARVHRIGTGTALMATVGWRVLLLCCCAAPIAMVVAKFVDLAMLPIPSV